MSLTRESRVLIVLGVFGLGAVVVLMAMAEKYRSMIEATDLRDPQVSSADVDPGNRAPAPGAMKPFRGDRGGQAEANDQIRRYLVVRRTIAETSSSLIGPQREIDASTRDRVRSLRDFALERAGLEIGRYEELRRMHSDWVSGSWSGPERFRVAFEAVADDLQSTERKIHRSLEL